MTLPVRLNHGVFLHEFGQTAARFRERSKSNWFAVVPLPFCSITDSQSTESQQTSQNRPTIDLNEYAPQAQQVPPLLPAPPYQLDLP